MKLTHECATYTVRVTGGTFDGAHESVYACEKCAPILLDDIAKRFPDARIVPLRSVTS